MTLFTPFFLLLDILLRPSKWRSALAKIDPDLPPEFSLIELSSTHWRHPSMQRLLFHGYLLLPLLLFGICTVGHLALDQPIDGLLATFAFTLIIGLTFGITMSTAVGIAVIAVVGTSTALLWPNTEVILFDMLFGVRFAQLFGLSSALMLIVVANCSRQSAQQALGRQIGGVILGLIVSVIVMVGASWLVLNIISARQTENLPGNSVGIVLALLPTLLLGLATYLQSRSWRKSVAIGLMAAVIFMLCFGRIGAEYGLEFGGNELLIGMSSMTVSVFFILTILPFALTRRFVGPWPAAVAGAFGSLAIYPPLEQVFSIFTFQDNLLLAIGLLLGGLTFSWLWSLIAYLFEAGWNTLLYQLDSRHNGKPIRWLPYHAVFWDEVQSLPFFELSDYLVLAAEQGVITNGSANRSLLQGEALIRAVNGSQQQWAAQAARTELDARRLEQLDNVDALATTSADAAAGLLSTPAGLLLRSFAQLGGDVAAALAQPSPYNQRLVLNSVAHDLENLQIELGRDVKNQLAVRYQSVAQQWHTVVSHHINALDETMRANQEIPNPYIVGVPLTRRQEIFVGRTDVARYVEDILRMGDHPPVLLYGPRRMGKTSLLYQLHWMLPRRILPLVVDLQGPISLASSNQGFLYALARGIRRAAGKNEIALPDLPRDTLAHDPFTVFDDWLNRVGETVAGSGRDTILLALDEFEALDASLSAGVLEERAVLGMLRHIVQHRRGIKLLLCGSHTLAEFRRWSSYLINAQVVALGYLDEEAARQLIETPIQDFPLRYEPTAVEHILGLTHGHPYLVQLLCMEIIVLKNRQPQERRHLTTVEDVEVVVPAMLERGQQFFADIELNQIDEAGRVLLTWLAKQGPGHLVKPQAFDTMIDRSQREKTLKQLCQRALLTEKAGRYCFEVEVVRRWFAKG